MIYFINFGVPKQKSGIEHAELKRLKLFEKHQVPCKIIVRNWDRNLHVNAKDAGIDDNHLLGLFDYYQKVTHVEDQKIYIEDLDFGLKNLNYENEKENSRYIVRRSNGKMVARVNYDDSRRIVSTELFDGQNNLYRVDHYDARGFVSLIQWYTPDNKIGTEEWLDLDGHVVIRTFNRFNIHNKLIKSGWWIKDLNNKEYVFDTLDQFFEHFLNELNQSNKNIFILDRSLLADAALIRLDRPAYTVMHFHNSQSSDAQNPMNPIPNNNYEFALSNLDNYSAIVCATEKQTRDIIRRCHPKADVYTIPVGIVPEEQINKPHIAMDKRLFGKIIAVARIAYEKHLDDLVRAMSIVHEQIPKASLDLYGYVNNLNEKKKIQKLIEDEHLENIVSFKGYTNNLNNVYNQAQIFGLTSRMEGFNLAIMEALSHGCVGITYDVNYGPNDIVKNNQNGYIVDYGDYKQLAIKIINLLQNPAKLQFMSDQAYDLSQRYSEDVVWTKWNNLIQKAYASLPNES